MKNFDSTQRKLLFGRAALYGLALVAGLSAFLIPGGQSVFGIPSAPFRIVAFGSSSTEGIGATRPSLSYPAQLQSILTQLVPDGRRVEVINRGISGEDADDMAKRIERDVIARHPDVVIWQTGSNDPLRHVPLDRFETQTRAGITQMRKRGINIILMEPQWCPRLELAHNAKAYIEAVRRVGRDMNVEVIRRSDLMHAWIRDGILTRRQMLAPDGLHMTDGGYALLARSLAPKVLKIEDALSDKEAASGEAAMKEAGSLSTSSVID